MAPGERVWLSHVHAETQGAAMTLTSPGTAAAPCEVLCGNDGAEPPTALATTATISTTGNSAITFQGYAYVYGIIFQVADGAQSTALNIVASATPGWFKFDSSSLRLRGSGTGGRINIGANSNASDDTSVELVNTTLSFANVAQGISIRCRFGWVNTAAAILGTIPTTLFLTPTAGNSGGSEVTGVDLSAAGSGKNLVDAAAATPSYYLFADCKLGASVGITTGAVAGQGGVTVRMVNCDSADTNYRYHFQCYQGTITQETTIIRTGGASDGTTALARKMVSTANSKFYSPLVDDWSMPIWNETLSARTITIPVLTDNVTLTDADAWIEVEYLGTTGFPLGVFANDRAATIIATPANQTTDGVSSWASAPGTPVKQLLAVTFTPAEKGVMRARVVLARASTTLYYDPKLQVT